MAAWALLSLSLSVAMAPAPAADSEPIEKSIKDWAKCDGSSDESAALTQAFAAASHSAFTLRIDCPLRFKVGTDIGRTIFIDDGTHVRFTPSGKLIVDNVFIPAFVIANSHDITLTGWNVEYAAGLPVNHDADGYFNDGQFIRGQHPSAAFNDRRMTPWLAAHRRIVFDGSQGHVTSFWTGQTNICAIFYIAGDSSGIQVTGMHVAVPAAAGADRFVPVVFSLNPNLKSNQSVNAKTPYSPQAYALPHDVKFSDVTLDGTYMGWVGSVQDAVFENIVSLRYADLEDAGGGTIGGVGKWFAPPHLIYLSYSTSVDPSLFNRDVTIRNVDDEGRRVGKARDLGGSDRGSGNALSLKIGCVHCTVDHYKSARPDGFVDVLSSDGLTLSNVDATYDSGFLNNMYPGWRFPQPPYKNVTFENITLKDVASATLHLPIENAADSRNDGLRFINVRVEINSWSGPGHSPLPNITGQTGDSALDFRVGGRKVTP